MKYIDSHAHVYSEKFLKDKADMIERSREAGLVKIYMPNIDHTSIDDMLEMEVDYPDLCIPMMGLHPCSVDKKFEQELYTVENWLSKRHFCAVGEIGTDLYWDKSLFSEQKEAFNIQCDLAIQYDIPVAIHCRESIDETIELVAKKQSDELRGVFHCFTGSEAQAEKIIDLGFVLGIGGVATFKNGGLEGVLEKTPLDKLLLETDSPYLAPVPHRGKRNEPAYMPEVARKIASIKEIALETVCEQTSKNTTNLFDYKRTLK